MRARIKREKEKRLPFPIVGQVKCGEKSEKGFPRSLDYFVVSGSYSSLFKEAYGEKPSTIQIVFPSDDPELCCIEEYEFWDSNGKKVASGDGETFSVYSSKTDKYTEVSVKDYPDIMELIAKKNQGREWKATLRLNFIIPKIRGVMGCWSFVTRGSASSIPTIRDTFDQVLETNGKVAGVIFDLSVKFAKSNKPGSSSKFPVVSLVPNESRQNIEMVKESRKPIMIEE